MASEIFGSLAIKSSSGTNTEGSTSGLGEGKSGMVWDNDIETCILSYVKRIASPGFMHHMECLGLVHWDDPEG